MTFSGYARHSAATASRIQIRKLSVYIQQFSQDLGDFEDGSILDPGNMGLIGIQPR